MPREVIKGIPAMTVTDLAEILSKTIDELFPRRLWIEGEIAEMRAVPHSSGHYFDLIDGSGANKRTLNMKLFSQSGRREFVEEKMKTYGVPLSNGLRVRFLCRLNFYAKRGEIGAIIDDVDPNFTLGELAMKREQLIAKIREAGLDEVNKQIKVPSVPLRIGVVSSGQADGWKDALKRFDDCGYPFHILFCGVSVQGQNAPREIAAAIRTLSNRRDIDLILLLRGGGSKADLAAFDDEGVVMAIVKCRRPVFTGVGHTMDNSIADIVAKQSFATPTAAAEAVIVKIRRFMANLNAKGQELIDESRSAVRSRRHRVATSARALESKARQGVSRARELNHRQATILGSRPQEVLVLKRQQLEGLATSVKLLDPATLLARGWSVTRGADGRVIRSVEEIRIGNVITTSFANGSAVSEVKEIGKP